MLITSGLISERRWPRKKWALCTKTGTKGRSSLMWRDSGPPRAGRTLGSVSCSPLTCHSLEVSFLQGVRKERG